MTVFEYHIWFKLVVYYFNYHPFELLYIAISASRALYNTYFINITYHNITFIFYSIKLRVELFLSNERPNIFLNFLLYIGIDYSVTSD